MKKILKLNRHNTKKEMEFELEYLSTLSRRERFMMMFKRTKELLSLLEKNGQRRPFKIIKRT